MAMYVSGLFMLFQAETWQNSRYFIAFTLHNEINNEA